MRKKIKDGRLKRQPRKVVPLMKNKMGLIIGFIVMLVLIVAISAASVVAASNGSTRMGGIRFGGGRAELRNTIEIPLSEVENLTLAYSSKNIRFYPGTSDSVIIKEYLVYADDVANVTYPGEKRLL